MLTLLALPAQAQTWETLLSNSSFANYSAFESQWNYLYPWGSDHNGTARMYGSSSDHNHIWLSGSVLNLKAVRINWNEGNSSKDPYLPIKYHSGAVHWKQHVLINDQFPNYEVKATISAPYSNGCWPAFWLTGVNSWSPESDIMEFKGNNNNWQNTFHGVWPNVTNNSIITAVNNPLNFHEYRAWISKVNATEVDIHYYIDGQWKGVHRAAYVGKPMWLILNLQMEGSSGQPGPANATMRVNNIYVGRTRNW
jgi:galactan endo-beta-1,3-galactanase